MALLFTVLLWITSCELFELNEKDWSHGVGFHHLDGTLESTTSSRMVVPLKIYSFGKPKTPVLLTEYHVKLLYNESIEYDVTLMHGLLFPPQDYYLLKHTAKPADLPCTKREQHSWECTLTAGQCLTKSPTLKIMSYNIWNLNKRTSCSYLDRIEVIVRQILSLDVDIVAFQEVRITNHEYPSKSKTGSQVKDLSDRLPGYQFVYQAGMLYQHNGEDVSTEGVAIFSKFPILSHDYKFLSRNFSDKEDQQHQRVCLAAVIATPLGVVTVATTHSSLSQTARLRNTVEMIDFLYQLPFPHIIAGDFNTEPESVEIQHLLGNRALAGRHVNYQSALNINAKDWTFTTLSTSPKKMIDFIFYSNAHYSENRRKPETKSCSLDSASDRTKRGRESTIGIRCLEGYVVPNEEPTSEKPVIPSDHRAIVATFGLIQEMSTCDSLAVST